MKLAFVLGTSTGGMQRHVRMLATGLAGRGVSVDVYGPPGSWPAAAVPARGVGTGGPDGPRFTEVDIGSRLRHVHDLAAAWRLRGLLARSRPDVVHAHGLRAGALAALAAGAGWGAGHRGARPGLVVTVHNAPSEAGLARRVYQLLERIVARRAGLVLCVSSDLEARMLAAGARRVQRAVVPAPAAQQPGAGAVAGVRAELGGTGGPAGTPVVLTVARLAPQKGLGTLIDAAARWRGEDPSPLLVIAGDGPLRGDLARRADAAGVAIRFLGQRDDVPALLAAADVVVLPSVWEGQPLTVQESLRAGRPLVASRAGGIPDLTGEEAALLVPAGDAAALSAAVLAVLGDPALSARLGQAALRRSRLLPSEQDAIDAAMAGYLAIRPG